MASDSPRKRAAFDEPVEVEERKKVKIINEEAATSLQSASIVLDGRYDQGSGRISWLDVVPDEGLQQRKDAEHSDTQHVSKIEEIKENTQVNHLLNDSAPREIANGSREAIPTTADDEAQASGSATVVRVQSSHLPNRDSASISASESGYDTDEADLAQERAFEEGNDDE
ncbi:hypothetical protein BDV96DRAFT_238528 [Lophiotrema nucula]|uniref:Uncharacterized protein n=1 Tax=Lophiotrema nucula TaxID=690887 RepID=A0A6A5YQI1_9PLEO|nr:hypothetical protein BDV96DRAFT_238528 [Lophiotrema nucula]